MAAFSWPQSRQTAIDLNGEVVPGARLQFFIAGTTTPFTVYSDSALSTPLPAYPDSIEADANGRWPRIYMPYGSYRERARTPAGVLLWDDDGIANPDPAEAAGGGTTVTADQIFKTGDIKPSFEEGPLFGFVRLNALTIGNDGSGATERANDDTLPLYTLLYDRFDDNVCPVAGGRGANAASDFSAGKTLGLPDTRGRVLAGADEMGNSAAGRFTGGVIDDGDGSAAGSSGGRATHTLTAGQNGVHAHTATSPVTDPGHTHGPGSGSNFQNSTAGTTFHDTTGGGFVTTLSPTTATSGTGITVSTTVNNSAGGEAHNNLQPFMTVIYYIHL